MPRKKRADSDERNPLDSPSMEPTTQTDEPSVLPAENRPVTPEIKPSLASQVWQFLNQHKRIILIGALVGVAIALVIGISIFAWPVTLEVIIGVSAIALLQTSPVWFGAAFAVIIAIFASVGAAASGTYVFVKDKNAKRQSTLDLEEPSGHWSWGRMRHLFDAKPLSSATASNVDRISYKATAFFSSVIEVSKTVLRDVGYWINNTPRPSS